MCYMFLVFVAVSLYAGVLSKRYGWKFAKTACTQFLFNIIVAKSCLVVHLRLSWVNQFFVNFLPT